MTILDKLYATGVIGLVSTFLIVARRYKNPDKQAGVGVAGWAIFTIFLIWT